LKILNYPFLAQYGIFGPKNYYVLSQKCFTKFYDKNLSNFTKKCDELLRKKYIFEQISEYQLKFPKLCLLYSKETYSENFEKLLFS